MRVKYFIHILVLSSLIFSFAMAENKGSITFETEALEFEEILNLADSLAESQQYDSAVTIGGIALSRVESLYGREDSNTANVLYHLGGYYYSNTDYMRAESTWTRVLEIRKLVYGPEHLEIVSCLDALALVYDAQNMYEESISVQITALGIREEAFGPDHPIVAKSLKKLGTIYQDKGDYEKAEHYFSRALRIREKTLEADSKYIAESQSNLALTYKYQGKYSKSESLYQKAMEILKKEFGPNDILVVDCLNSLGDIYASQGKYLEAEDTLLHALSVVEKTLGADHYQAAIILNTLGSLYSKLGRYDEGESCLKRSIAICEVTTGREHPLVLASLGNLANIYQSQGKYSQAISLAKQVLEINKNTLEPGHPRIATVIGNLGLAYYYNDEYSKAEPLYLQAISIMEAAFGSDHPGLAGVFNNLGLLYYDIGNYSECVTCFEKNLQILENTFGPEHPDVATAISNLSFVRQEIGDFPEAESLIKRVLGIREKSLGPNHPSVAWTLDNLAIIYVKSGRYDEAEALYQRALEITQKAFGSSHPDIALFMHNLADSYYQNGKYSKAEELFLDVLRLRETLYGEEHPRLANSLLALAKVHACKNEFDKSHIYYEKFIDSRQQFIPYAFSFSSEKQKLNWVKKHSPFSHSLLSLALLNRNSRTSDLALKMLLGWKAQVLDAVTAEREFAFCSDNAELIGKIDENAGLCTIIANMVLGAEDGNLIDNYNDSLKYLFNRQKTLEEDISRQCSEYREKQESFVYKVSDITNALPKGSMLWEFVEYRPYDFSKKGSDEDRFGPEHYLGITLNCSGDINLIDLGEASKIDSLIELTRRMLNESNQAQFGFFGIEMERQLNKVTGELYKLLFFPMSTHLDNQTVILASLDGMLNLLPFEILPTFDGTYVIEKYSISYLSSSRDLLKFERIPKEHSDVVVMANPNFDAQGLDQKIDPVIRTQMKTSLAISNFLPVRGSISCLGGNFEPLFYGKEEAKLISQTFLLESEDYNVILYYGSDASEDQIKNLASTPKILHIITHGFFCDSDVRDNGLQYNNPLLQSGLALAGANTILNMNKDSILLGEDGILTAYEVSSLNLLGTELVSLSACETGIGELVNGEGVFGLRRAFQHAGAKSIIMSLWNIPDKETSVLMDEFYKQWLGGKSKSEALRHSAIDALNKSRKEKGHGHPLFWGGFVLAGNPN